MNSLSNEHNIDQLNSTATMRSVQKDASNNIANNHQAICEEIQGHDEIPTNLMLVNASSRISVTSPPVSNILVLLNTLYTSGFATNGPNQPLLSGRTMHTLYAVSFLIYSLSCLSDWIYAYCTLRGYVTSFPLKAEITIALVSIAVIGSMINSLLLVLCIENAFAYRVNISPYHNGFALIFETFSQWIQAFNNFRIVFLYMALHDLPITIINFFYLSACQCIGPKVWQWPMILITMTTIVNIVWRLIMLYVAYQRMICPVKKSSRVTLTSKNLTVYEQLRDGVSQRGGGRLKEYDECWPTRFSYRKIFGDAQASQHNDEIMHIRMPSTKYSRNICYNFLSTVAFKIVLLLIRFIQILLFLLLTISLYLLSTLSCCSPCCYHYVYSKNSFYHRHKCSRTFVRRFSQWYNCFMFLISLVTTVILFILNAAILTSVHGIGNNQIPYEISHICISINIPNHLLRARLETKSINHLSNHTHRFICKPIWDDGGFGLGTNRQEAGTWQTRIMVQNDRIMAISTKVVANYNDRQYPHHVLLYDYAVLERSIPTTKKMICQRGIQSKWLFIPGFNELPWPYFTACEESWTMQKSRMIGCYSTDELEEVDLPSV